MSQPNTRRAVSKRYYTLRLDSYYGDNSSLTCQSDGTNTMYAVLVVTDSSAEIVDMGYSSVPQLLEAWFDITFVNLGFVN